MSARNLWIVGAAVLIVLGAAMVIDRHVGPGAFRRKFAEAVPRYNCPSLWPHISHGQWTRGGVTLSGGLEMPVNCVDRLRAALQADHRFGRRVCNVVEDCWTRRDGRSEYTIYLRGKQVGFRYADTDTGS